MTFGRPRGWGALALRQGNLGLAPPPPPPPGYTRSPKACPAPGSGGAAPSQSTPVPRVPWTRYQDPGFQETYARIYGALREPAVLGVKVVPEEQADAMARQIIDAIIALPQSAELKFRVGCAVKDMVLGPVGITIAVLLGLGVAGVGTWAVVRSRRRSA
jgi:hypothetical protein